MAAVEPFRRHGVLGWGQCRFQGLWGLVSTPAEYRKRAAECLRLSRGKDNPDLKALYVGLAQAWVTLAQQVESRLNGYLGIIPADDGPDFAAQSD